MDLNDEKLVAYIDGELDAAERDAVSEALAQDGEARERLETLENGGRPFAEAFDTLLPAAPDDKLQAMFADLVAQKAIAPDAGETVVPLRRDAPQAGGVALWRMAAAAAILALVFSGGLVTGGFFDKPQEVAAQNPGWREVAARYVALFSKETLEGMPSSPVQRLANLARIETALGLSLPEDRISDPALRFQGTQLLQLAGKPLAQIAYLNEGEKPVALCIIQSANPPAGPATEKRHGLNVVHWVADGYGYMVLGDVPEAELAEIAQRFREQFS